MASHLFELLSGDEGLQQNFQDIFEYNYHPIDWEQDQVVQNIVPQPPLIFYDLHVERNLNLKTIKEVNFSLRKYLLGLGVEEVGNFIKQGHSFSTKRPTGLTIPFHVNSSPKSSLDVRDYYWRHVGVVAAKFAANLCINPRYPTWNSCIFAMYEEGNERNERFCKEAGLSVLRLQPVESPGNSVPQQVVDALRKLHQTKVTFAIWELFASTRATKTLVRSLGPFSRFPWAIANTNGHSINLPPLTPPEDGHSGLITMLGAPDQVAGPRQASPDAVASAHISIVEATVSAPPRIGARRSGRRPYVPSATHHIQHAWARAVLTDSTFIIFHCGRYERIGIRHRKTQTLYLSELVDTVLSSDPTYRTLHIGLYIAILKDLLDRKASHSAENASKIGPKRRRNSISEGDGQRKRRRLDSETTNGSNLTDASKIEDIDLAEELESRMLALIYLNYGCYRSPAPSSFHRVAPPCSFTSSAAESLRPPKRKGAYKAFQYFSLVLGEPLAGGAVGIGHPAEVVFTCTSRGFVRNENLVIKLAFGENEQEKMWHEYSIYQHMWRNKDMKGIVKIYGMFQDAETGTLALLMEHGGTSATKREAARTGQIDVLHLTSKERDSLEFALNSIHEAGVVHGDVRSDNIVIDSSNQFRIIDFDCAILENPRTSLKMDFESQSLGAIMKVVDSA
ncbi:hypothetical protein NLJ89_g1624 [Agrocybe chaxingu]|uniref:Protein kinase domain-containing protein n=1 Tax=Agrocybe chaxingu TaxID=84603 RepID=A0A9W8MZP5_9AGAR|nr:hypothetical protein NLJ89_g1624 [Agrocybe chaxingu]